MTSQPTILLVEGDPAVSDGLDSFLTEAGFAVLHARTGVEALALLGESPIDLVLLDLRLTQPGGLEVLRSIQESSPECPVLVVSGGEDADDAAAAVELGAWDYLPRPMESLVLLGHSITNALERQRLLRQVGEYRQQLEDETRRHASQLAQAAKDVEAKNIALREVLSSIDSRSQEVGQRVAANIENLVLPLLHSLGHGLSRAQTELVKEIEQALQEIASPFVDRLAAKFESLSPSEVKLCELIRRGLDNKTIARLTSLSVQTIATHRRNIRRKLGLSSRKVNMTSYLRSLEGTGDGKP